MIQATVFNRKTGVVVALVSGKSFENLRAAHVTDELDIREGFEELPPEPPLPAHLVRDRLLNESVWAILPDSPLSDEAKQAFIDYRKELHVILKDAPEDVVWPEAPAMAFPTDEPLADERNTSTSGKA